MRREFEKLPIDEQLSNLRVGLRAMVQSDEEVGSLAGDREFRVSDPDRLTSHDDKTFGRDTRGLILRMVVVGFLTMLFWHTVIAAGTP